MKIAQLSRAVAQVVDKRRSARRLGPRRITAVDAAQPDSSHALPELLAATRSVVQNDAQRALVHQLAAILAEELVRLGTQSAKLLKPGMPRLDTEV